MFSSILVLSSARGFEAWQQASHFLLVSSCQTRFEDSIRVGAADSSAAGVLLAPRARAAWEPDESDAKGVGRGGYGKGRIFGWEKKARNTYLRGAEGWLEAWDMLQPLELQSSARLGEGC